MGICKHVGGTKHMGASQHMQGIQTYGGVQTYRGHFCMPSYPAKRVLLLVNLNER